MWTWDELDDDERRYFGAMARAWDIETAGIGSVQVEIALARLKAGF